MLFIYRFLIFIGICLLLILAYNLQLQHLPTPPEVIEEITFLMTKDNTCAVSNVLEALPIISQQRKLALYRNLDYRIDYGFFLSVGKNLLDDEPDNDVLYYHAAPIAYFARGLGEDAKELCGFFGI